MTSALRRLCLVAAFAGCASDAEERGTSVETGRAREDTALYVEGPALPHATPVPPALCFDCHLCASNGATALAVTHYVCADCHKGPDGSVPEGVQSDCGCGGLDCGTEPPTLGCGGCHTDGSDGNPSAEHMNGLCLHCHAERP